jgi:hypothetical protein
MGRRRLGLLAIRVAATFVCDLVGFLRRVVARVSAKKLTPEIGLAVTALLDAGESLGDARPFRKA